MKRYLLFLLSAILLILPHMARADSVKIPIKGLNDLSLDLSKERPKNKLHLDRSHPITLSYLLQYKQFHTNQTQLIFGFRPEDDKPKKASHVSGQKWTDRDWVLEESCNSLVLILPVGYRHDNLNCYTGLLEPLPYQP